MRLILPGHPYYKPTLAQAPQWWRTIAGDKAEPGILLTDQYGVMHQRSLKEYRDWAIGGGYEEEFGLTEDDFEPENCGW